jgi:4-diphosphocytidyl-2-C-methyl-D-erythritol kinase
MPSITVSAPAKINLGLQIGKLNKHGLHELSSFMQTIDLQDEITIAATKATRLPAKLDIKIKGADLPTGPENLVYRAAKGWQEKSGLELDLKVELLKRIPQGAGLGGGSSDAASTLLALNRLFPENALSEDKLLTLAQSLGSDVPFFLRPGLALVRGSGEKILPLGSLNPFHLLLVKPNFCLATGEVFAALDKARDEGKLAYTQPFIKEDLIKMQTKPELWSQCLKNDFTPLLCQQYHSLGELLDVLEASSACFSSLSGSGPTCYAVFKEKATRDQALVALKKQFPDYWFCAAKPLA